MKRIFVKKRERKTDGEQKRRVSNLSRLSSRDRVLTKLKYRVWYSISFATTKFFFFSSLPPRSKRETGKHERILNAILSVISQRDIPQFTRRSKERERGKRKRRKKKKKTCRILHASCIKSRTRARSLNNEEREQQKTRNSRSWPARWRTGGKTWSPCRGSEKSPIMTRPWRVGYTDVSRTQQRW